MFPKIIWGTGTLFKHSPNFWGIGTLFVCSPKSFGEQEHCLCIPQNHLGNRNIGKHVPQIVFGEHVPQTLFPKMFGECVTLIVTNELVIDVVIISIAIHNSNVTRIVDHLCFYHSVFLFLLSFLLLFLCFFFTCEKHLVFNAVNSHELNSQTILSQHDLSIFILNIASSNKHILTYFFPLSFFAFPDSCYC